MNVLITGNLGYVGSVVTRYLRRQRSHIKIVGYDAGFFAHALSGADTLPEIEADIQLFGDVRDISSEALQGVDAVVHLAAISNDPMGNEFADVTLAINQEATVRLVRLCISAGVRNFVYASSCSMYGQGGETPRTEDDITQPLTAYAKSKIGSEMAVRELTLGQTVFTSLRFATACGMSDRLRLDLVLNDFVAGAMTSGEIVVLSDGTPWRPLIDVADMARAIDWAITRRSEDGGAFLAVNAGRTEYNYQVREVAEAVMRTIPGTRLRINEAAPPDRRSYRVDFSLFQRLAPGHIPIVSLDESVHHLREGLDRMRFRDSKFRESAFMRLNMLRGHVVAQRLDRQLRWVR